jgi:dynein heavy chain
MQKELQELQPVLASTAEQVEAMMAQIATDKEAAASTRAQVQGQERDANEQAAAAKAMAADAQRELDAALPALDAAVASLKNLSRCVGGRWRGARAKALAIAVAGVWLGQSTARIPNLPCSPPHTHRNDIVEVKSLQNPPAGVKLVMETACIMFDEKPKMKEDPTKMGAQVGRKASPLRGGLRDLRSLLQGSSAPPKPPQTLSAPAPSPCRLPPNHHPDLHARRQKGA